MQYNTDKQSHKTIKQVVGTQPLDEHVHFPNSTAKPTRAINTDLIHIRDLDGRAKLTVNGQSHCTARMAEWGRL